MNYKYTRQEALELLQTACKAKPNKEDDFSQGFDEALEFAINILGERKEAKSGNMCNQTTT